MTSYYDKTKTGLYALGFINTSTYLYDLQQLCNVNIDPKTLDSNVQEEITKNRVIFYNYTNGDPVASSVFDEKSTFIKAVQTGYADNNGTKILAYFKRNKYGQWASVRYSTQNNLFNKINAYKMGFISFRSYTEANDFIIYLEGQLLPGETWDFQTNTNESNIEFVYRQKTRFQILESYIQQIFSKLFLEYDNPQSKNHNKIIFSTDGKFCIFNTGLLTKYAKDICIIGEVYRNRQGKFFALNNPQKIDSKSTLITKYGFVKSEISEWPPVIEFFNCVNDIIYDSNIEIDMTEEKLNHIIIDGIKRDRFSDKYKTLLEEGKLPRIANDFELGIKNAQIIATRNYKYVVPQYRPQIEQNVGKIQFLMPIYLDGDYNEMPDFALVLNKEGDFYVPETILELSWAYNNARVICKPDDSWLKPDEITDMVNIEAEITDMVNIEAESIEEDDLI